MLEGLAAGTYYWQVRYTSDYTNYTYPDGGVLWSFTKASGVSGKFAPENGTAGHGSSLWLSWSAVEDSAYRVCVLAALDETCNGGASWVTNGGSTSKLLTGLSAGTYYWQVEVQTGSSYTYANSGTWWRFTVGDDTSEPGSGTSSVTREYIYLGSMLLAAVESGTTLTYYHADALGSVRAITSSSGSTVSRQDYFPFGEGGTLSGDPRKFIGGELDAETAFDYLGARYYRNVWGRFTSVDPIFAPDAMSNPQAWNRYAYGLNSPLRFSDPTGLAASEVEPYQVEEYGVTGFSPEEFDAWVNGYMAKQDTRFACDSPLDRMEPQGVVTAPQEPSQQAPLFDRFLKFSSDLFAGAGDCLTGRCFGFSGSFTESARQRYGFDDVVNKNSWSYFGGELFGGTLMMATAELAAAKYAFGLRSKVIFYDPKPHYFPILDMSLPHFQVNLWMRGVKGSEFAFRIPLPPLKWPW